MPILPLAELTAPEVQGLDPDCTCLVLTVSPIEQHGPHLPLGTDIVESEGVARRLCEQLTGEFPEWTFLFYPAVPLGADCFEHPGTASVRPQTVQAVVEDIGLAYARQGFRHLILSSHHGGPRHNLALEAAARTIARRSPMRVLSLAGRLIVELYFGGGLQEFYARLGIPRRDRATLDLDVHAGAFETSEMLALRPELVREGWQDLQPVTVPLDQLSSRATDTARGRLGYFGAPALASAELGEAYLAFVLGKLLPEARRFLRGGHVPGLSAHWRLILGAAGTVAQLRAAFTRATPLDQA